ncbi:CLUMA_CG012919, isoform A [Clunio marinus]|uniref:CLUMA_CG012919, isoform A n=1 Tax=Clunio marinus TaxID=568069 RepID=A0A1J1IH68_9DIPT|nr:CLUMA_CG012919, isoform A [Clunio marinus]
MSLARENSSSVHRHSSKRIFYFNNKDLLLFQVHRLELDPLNSVEEKRSISCHITWDLYTIFYRALNLLYRRRLRYRKDIFAAFKFMAVCDFIGIHSMILTENAIKKQQQQQHKRL